MATTTTVALLGGIVAPGLAAAALAGAVGLGLAALAAKAVHLKSGRGRGYRGGYKHGGGGHGGGGHGHGYGGHAKGQHYGYQSHGGYETHDYGGHVSHGGYETHGGYGHHNGGYGHHHGGYVHQSGYDPHDYSIHQNYDTHYLHSRRRRSTPDYDPDSEQRVHGLLEVIRAEDVSGCGFKLVCELGAVPFDQLSEEGEAILNLVGPSIKPGEGLGPADAKMAYRQARGLGEAGKSCNQKFYMCPLDGAQIMGSITNLLP